MTRLKENEAKRILLIVQNLPVPYDRRVWQEATTLRSAGYNVAVICPKKKIYTKGYEMLNGIEIYRYLLIYEGSRGVFGYFVEFIYCWLASLWLSVKIYLRHPFHLIHACNPPDTYFALAFLYKVFGVKFIFDYHDRCPEIYIAKGKLKDSLLYKGLILLERWTFKTADLIISTNESHKETAIKRGEIDESKIVIVRSAPSLSWAKINPYDEKAKRGKQYLVVYLGEMNTQDGVDNLLRSIAYYKNTYPPDTSFVLIGGGTEKELMEDMSTELGLGEDVHFTGSLFDEKLLKELSTADVCVVPDPFNDYNNMSTMNKIIEYMALGKPIVAFDLLEHRRSARDAAVYVTPNNEIQFAEAIRSLLDDPEKRQAMSAYGRERFINHLAWEHSEKQLLAAYGSLNWDRP